MITIEGYPVESCPFCGGGNLAIHGLRQVKGHEDADDIWKYIQCMDIDCQATGPVDLGVSGAIDAWNTRAIAVK